MSADDNIVQSFQLESSNLMGRIVRLGSVLEDILRPHAYPQPVAHMVAETVTLALLLSSMLKFDGIFTLQTKGDGAIKMLVADVTSAGDVRACATYDAQHLALNCAPMAGRIFHYLGEGYIAFTVDQGGHTERYQGIVELRGESLVDCVQHYFTQSEQIQTGLKMSVGLTPEGWRGGGIMLQKIPEEGGVQNYMSNIDEDDWRRTMVLLQTCTESEFLDCELGGEDLLLRLFHEEGVRVYPPQLIQKKCRCTSGRVESILQSMSEDDLEHMYDGGKIVMKCEFCSKEFSYDFVDIRTKHANS